MSIAAMVLACQTAMSAGFCIAIESPPPAGSVVLIAGLGRISGTEWHRIRAMGWTKGADGAYQMCAAIPKECSDWSSQGCVALRSMWGA